MMPLILKIWSSQLIALRLANYLCTTGIPNASDVLTVPTVLDSGSLVIKDSAIASTLLLTPIVDQTPMATLPTPNRGAAIVYCVYGWACNSGTWWCSH
jgi:hypothetical protein